MSSGSQDRAYWVSTLNRIVRPVLAALANRQLKKVMPVETNAADKSGRATVTHLEALGRTLAGIAPWLELPADDSDEGKLRSELAELSRKSIDAGTDPASPDYMNFTIGGQPVVDAAFLSHAIVRAPNALWQKLPLQAQQNTIAALQSTRTIKPGMNNWLLFSAMVEAALCVAGHEWHPEPIDFAITKHMEWYKGDGNYGDGPWFHCDYYNSFVIHPMLIDVLETVGTQRPQWNALRPTVLARAHRYAAVQERMISPEGTFPVVGRSLAYRFGVFQLLGQIALRKELPADISPAQVRCAMTAVIRRMIEAPRTFDEQGFLRVGFCGHQPDIGEGYISTGSLYLCTVGLLPLGLPANDPFWTDEAKDWTSRRAWSGEDVAADHALGDS
jgi:hypothetical protein